jgi:predicted metal-dependent peptidase
MNAITPDYRKAFDETINFMSVTHSPFFKDYVFYMHVLAQCKVVFKDIGAAAGVAFYRDHYVLCLNPKEVIAEVEKENGTVEEILGFTTKMPIEQRVGIIKHEMLHIILDHVHRLEDRDFKKFNIATDCALDQEIPKEHLPSYAIYPDNNFPTKLSPEEILWGETAEYYYDQIDDDELGDSSGADTGESGNSSPSSDNSPTKGNKYITVDDHTLWQESEGDDEIRKELTKKIVEDAIESTIKAKGNLPNNCQQILDNLTITREVDWKRQLKRIVGNKRAFTRKTILRRDRRQPNANWIKGKTKDRLFDLGVISDVSGSVSNQALIELWSEIINICDTFKVPVSLVQVDTEPKNPEKLTNKTKMVERKASGGTFLSPAIQKFKDFHISVDALVITTDGYLFENDIDPFKDLNIPVIWLIEKTGQIMPEMCQGKMKAIQLN